MSDIEDILTTCAYWFSDSDFRFVDDIFVAKGRWQEFRQVIAEDRVLRLDPTEILQVERTLDREAVEVPQLRRLLKSWNRNQWEAVDKPVK